MKIGYRQHLFYAGPVCLTLTWKITQVSRNISHLVSRLIPQHSLSNSGCRQTGTYTQTGAYAAQSKGRRAKTTMTAVGYIKGLQTQRLGSDHTESHN